MNFVGVCRVSNGSNIIKRVWRRSFVLLMFRSLVIFIYFEIYLGRVKNNFVFMMLLFISCGINNGLLLLL